ncbi:MAG: 1,3-beta-galactosyl-N-acetylhexosamine phosphorylase [Clostridiales bacterium]|nr:1,3-beta-galactosyl-N-acetylhexosamine phosphorylase [Clostridiales bacterium]
MNDYSRGGFTLPGEAGYEKLTLEMAEKWGADVIRDSDGTKLSDEITRAGYRIYSTICIIREHNAFAQLHPDAQQQSFLCSKPLIASSDTLEIRPMEGYFAEQFEVNDSPEAMEYWQVWDRTANTLVSPEKWSYSAGAVTVEGCEPFHRYSVSFLAWRVWEEINMYNHTTNHWTSEHLRQLDPRHPLAWEYLKKWLKDWCESNPQTDVVRLTSLFYNFVWIFGDDMRLRSRFVDWASYDFTVSPAALKAFEAEYGYALTAEDFINKGLLQATHRPPTKAKKDYMDFIQRFVAEKAKELVDIIHAYGKQAYVFYDDSWVGMEPCGKYFPSIGFDGLIKCVFSGFECRLCARAKVETHELRFHPYLFPVGLGGLPTFSEGGRPEKDALSYWMHVRRALARQTVQRIGLGGYLHLTIGQDKFNDLIADMAREFRHIKALHEEGEPAALPIRVAVMHYWGPLRSWTLSGHFHETDNNVLIHINEALSGHPVDVSFISFDDVKQGALKDVDVLINAGREGDAWSGGDVWKDSGLVSEITRFVYEGGSLIGAGEPSAVQGGDTLFALSHVFGVDMDKGQYACHTPWTYETQPSPFIFAEEAIGKTEGIRVTSPDTLVLLEKDSVPALTLNCFGKGRAIYMGGFTYSPEAANMLLEMLKYLRGVEGTAAGKADDPLVECAWFPKNRVLLVMNNAETPVKTRVSCPAGSEEITLEPFETRFMEL